MNKQLSTYASIHPWIANPKGFSLSYPSILHTSFGPFTLYQQDLQRLNILYRSSYLNMKCSPSKSFSFTSFSLSRSNVAK